MASSSQRKFPVEQWGDGPAYEVRSVCSKKKYININLIDFISIIPNLINRIVFFQEIRDILVMTWVPQLLKELGRLFWGHIYYAEFALIWYQGNIFSFFVRVVAAAEAAISLVIVSSIYCNRQSTCMKFVPNQRPYVMHKNGVCLPLGFRWPHEITVDVAPLIIYHMSDPERYCLFVLPYGKTKLFKTKHKIAPEKRHNRPCKLKVFHNPQTLIYVLSTSNIDFQKQTN